MGLQGSRRTFGKQIQYFNHEDKDIRDKDKVQTKFLEGALGHSWEDSSHGVDPVLGGLLHHTHHLVETESIMLATWLNQKVLSWQPDFLVNFGPPCRK